MSHRARKAREQREAAQRRVEKRERHADRQARLRDIEARRRDHDIDQPFYLWQLGLKAPMEPHKTRDDHARPAVVRVRGTL